MNSQPLADGSANAAPVRRTRRRGYRVHLLTVVLTVIAGLLIGLVVTPLHGLSAPRGIPWWMLVPLFGAAEIFVVHIQFRRDAHSFSLSELPLIAGLFFAPPLVVVLSSIGGAAAALVLYRRQSPLKVAFNLANFAVSNSLAVALFVHFVDRADPLGTASSIAVLTAVLTAGLIQSLIILAAISFSEGRIDPAGIVATFGFALAGTAVNTCLALIGVRLLWQSPTQLWLLLVPTVGVLIAYRFYVSEREKRSQVDFLYESSRELQHSEAVDEAVASLLTKACSVFRAEVAEITFLPTRDRDAVLRTAVGREGVVEFMSSLTLADSELRFLRRLLKDSPLILHARGGFDADHDAFLEQRGLRDAMAVVLRGENNMLGTMVVGNRLGEVTGFDDEDLRLLEMLANQTGAILEKGRLQHSLSQLTALQEQLQHQASHDPLTGMANRLLFSSRVEQALIHASSHIGVLFIDLDDFKTVNDSLGHAAGDSLLVAVADRIGRCLRPGDIAARLGGDEFAVLLMGVDDPTTAIRISERIIGSLHEPFFVQGEEVLTHASVGIATSTATERDAQQLLLNADLALYTAKSMGKARWALFEPAMHAAVTRRHRLKAELYRAVESGEFVLEYQPVVQVQTGRIVAAEALLRWNHPRRGLVYPGDFLDLVEETGLIVPLGRWVLGTACMEARNWRGPGTGESIGVSVNVAARQLQQPLFFSEVRAVLEETRLEAHRLILEVTEADIIRDPEPIIRSLRALQDIGVRIAIDDFGTGHSSLSRLRDFPVDVLKIDKSFTELLRGSEQSTGFANAVFSFGASLGLRVIAEGVETVEHQQALRDLGCEWAQGFLFSRSVPPNAMRDLLDQTSTLPVPAETSSPVPQPEPETEAAPESEAHQEPEPAPEPEPEQEPEPIPVKASAR